MGRWRIVGGLRRPASLRGGGTSGIYFDKARGGNQGKKRTIGERMSIGRKNWGEGVNQRIFEKSGCVVPHKKKGALKTFRFKEGGGVGEERARKEFGGGQPKY